MPTSEEEEEFVRRCRARFGDQYFYSPTRFRSAREKVEVGCPRHGSFWILPSVHLRGVGCRICGIERQVKARTYTTAQFIAKAQKVHARADNDYSPTVYTRSIDMIEAICRRHGPFRVRAGNHLHGTGCAACALEAKSAALLKSGAAFIAQAIAIHGDKYGYEQVVYRGAFEYVNLACRKPGHGIFSQTPDAHLNSRAGCPDCGSNRRSQPHREIEEFLVGLGVEFRASDRTEIRPLEIDIYLAAHRLGIEFNGQYWHSLVETDAPTQKFKHKKKFMACLNAGITLLQISEHEWSDPVRQAIWKSILCSKLKLQRKVAARKTRFAQLSRIDADRFFEQNHLQGSTPSLGWNFGLYDESGLVGVISFARHEKTRINLSRLAFRRGVTVVGGARKLFDNARKHLPAADIVTFSNNQYSGGAVYEKLGFTLQADLPVSYQWLFRNRVWNKRLLRHSKLGRVLGSAYDPALTEHQNMFRAGARCLYDAGYRRWIFTHSPVSGLPDDK